MFRNGSTSSRYARFAVLGFATLIAALVFSTDHADAKRRHHRVRHARVASYTPAFASIVVDANSGATLAANSADAVRHPASLTKIMTLYLLFEKLEQGKLKLDSEMDVSEHASEQAPTKLGLRPGQTLRVEDAIKALVTRSANDAAVVIAEAIADDEDSFAKLMTRRARSLGMSRTTYKNASGLPDDDQVTSARDQSLLGRAIQDRFPRYYRYFATNSFAYRGRVIRNHNKLLGRVEGVDGIKTGYTRASGFNLVSSMRRGNRHLVAVVLGGRSGGSRDAIMRNLLAEHVVHASTTRTAAAITDRDGTSSTADVAEAPAPAPARAQRVQVATADTVAEVKSSTPPAPLTSGVISTQPIAAIPGSAEPMTPVRVRTVQIKAGAPIKLASAGGGPAPIVTSAVPQMPAETSSSVVAKAERPQQPAGYGTGNGVLGVLPAQSIPSSQAMAYADPARNSAASVKTIQENGAIKAVTRSGWIVQVGALESESEARQRLNAARDHARGILAKADPFTETVSKGTKTFYRARFAGLTQGSAEAACKALKRSSISCMTVRN